MKKIISILIVVVLLFSSVATMIPISAAKLSYTPNWLDLKNRTKYIAYYPDGSTYTLTDFWTKYSVTRETNLLSPKTKANGAPACSYISTIQFAINSNTRYEYHVKVKSNSVNNFGGVVFAISPDNVTYHAYGGFNNSNHLSTQWSNQSHIITVHGDYTAREPYVGSEYVNDSKYFEELKLDSEGFASLKIAYEGLKVTVYAQSSTGEFVQMGQTVTLVSGSKLAFGVFNRNGSSTVNRTVSLKDAKIYALNDTATTAMAASGEALVNESVDEPETKPETESTPAQPLSVFDQEMALNKAQNDEILSVLLPKSTALRQEIKSKKAGYNFGTASSSIGTKKSSWTAATPTPIGDHPRLLITKDTIPTVKKALENKNDPTVKRFYELLNTQHAKNGQLGAATENFGGRKGLHNYDKELLELIQIKALAYVVGGHELYGYQAIHYMKQFLRTLDIQYINTNMEREYGNTMFTAALVYDWCYDLLTDVDKQQFIAGVENKTAKGTCGDPSYTTTEHYKWKMSVGFPPTKIGAVSGHASERQILRDYLSVAVAFYGDNNSWWNYIAACVYSEYVPVRNYYFQSGISQQGTGVYVSGRHISDMYSAWILMTATGSQPYNNIDKTVRNFLGYEIAPGKIFSDGDGTGSIQNNYEFRALSYMTAYLFADEPMLAQAKSMQPKKAFASDTIELTSAMYVALCGMSDIEPAEDKYEGMPLIQYNGSPVGQYIMHEAFGVTDSATILMRIKERTTANHEHADAGTFMIYYKGMLTADGGAYNGYSSDHTRYFHQATVSHNGLLIYNPNVPEANDSSLSAKTQANMKKWYSGGQIWPTEASNLTQLKSEKYLTGKVIGRSHGYLDSSKTTPLYAYINGNITNAYHQDTVDHVGRRMLTVYTQDEDVPMVFFVYDAITSDSANYKKTFLLQIPSSTAPKINKTNKTVATENGDGRLVLTCLTDGATITGVGGANNNYSTNGKQNSTSYETGAWGRVEITQTGAKSHKFLNSIYVTDKGNTTYYETKPITNVSKNKLSAGDVEGAVFNDSIVAVFAKKNLVNSSSFLSNNISFTAEGNSDMRYFVDGMAAGTWQITVKNSAGKTISTQKATASNGLLTFNAPAGNVTLTKVA